VSGVVGNVEHEAGDGERLLEHTETKEAIKWPD
jgi:hypothetical protein